MKKKGGRILFLALSWFAFMLVLAIAAITIYLISPRLEQFHSVLPRYFLAIVGFILLVVGGGLSLITITAFAGLDVLYPHGGEPITMRILFPVVVRLGVLFGIKKDRLLEAFVETNNSLVWAQRKRFSRERVLILLPHCLQHHECKWKITFDVSNCAQCGKCDIAELAKISSEKDVQMRVATGGTLARKVVGDYKPTIIIAVACGRDLSSGIIDAHPIPVLGIINQRPHGPCFDTRVNIEEVMDILGNILPVKNK